MGWPQWSRSSKSAELGIVQSFVITPDMVSKCHLFYDIKCVLGVLCRLPKQFQKAKDLSQDQATSDLDYHESEMLWSKDPEPPSLRVQSLYSATIYPMYFFSLRLQELFYVGPQFILSLHQLFVCQYLNQTFIVQGTVHRKMSLEGL